MAGCAHDADAEDEAQACDAQLSYPNVRGLHFACGRRRGLDDLLEEMGIFRKKKNRMQEIMRQRVVEVQTPDGEDEGRV